QSRLDTGTGGHLLVRLKPDRTYAFCHREARFEKSFKTAADAGVSSHHRPDGEHDERNRHRWRGIVQVGSVTSVVISLSREIVLVAVKGEEHEAEHVDCSQERGQQTNRPEQRVAAGER